MQSTIDEKSDDAITGIGFAEMIVDNLSLREVESIVTKIIVDENGNPDIQLKYNLDHFISFHVEDILNENENKKIETVFRLIAEEERDYTSAKYLSEKMNVMGYNTNNKSIMPYIKLAVACGVLEMTDDRLKPYKIMMNKAEIMKQLRVLF
jgi:hypothetical protein